MIYKVSVSFVIELLLDTGPQEELESVPAVFRRQQGHFNFKWAQMPHIFTAAHKKTQNKSSRTSSVLGAVAKRFSKALPKKPDINCKLCIFSSLLLSLWGCAVVESESSNSVFFFRPQWRLPGQYGTDQLKHSLRRDRKDTQRQICCGKSLRRCLLFRPLRWILVAEIWYATPSLLNRSFQPHMATVVWAPPPGFPVCWGQALTNHRSSDCAKQFVDLTPTSRSDGADSASYICSLHNLERSRMDGELQQPTD